MKNAAILIAVVLAACASGPKPVPHQRGPALGRFTAEQILEHAEELLDEMDIAGERERFLMAKLGERLEEKGFRARMEKHGISAVAAYRMAGGGFIVAAGRGRGVVSFAAGGSEVPFQINASALGAFIGGEGSWGIALVSGLQYESWFFGDYRGASSGATAVQTSTEGATLKSSRHAHKIHCIAQGAGLSAGAGYSEVFLTPPDKR